MQRSVVARLTLAVVTSIGSQRENLHLCLRVRDKKVALVLA
jgi:hypothetical protein